MSLNVTTEKGDVIYMNSGDWIENLTGLEYNDGAWQVYKYAEDPVAQAIDIDKKKKNSKQSAKEMMVSLMAELNVKGKTEVTEGVRGAIERRA